MAYHCRHLSNPQDSETQSELLPLRGGETQGGMQTVTNESNGITNQLYNNTEGNGENGTNLSNSRKQHFD